MLASLRRVDAAERTNNHIAANNVVGSLHVEASGCFLFQECERFAYTCPSDPATQVFSTRTRLDRDRGARTHCLVRRYRPGKPQDRTSFVPAGFEEKNIKDAILAKYPLLAEARPLWLQSGPCSLSGRDDLMTEVTQSAVHEQSFFTSLPSKASGQIA